MFLGVAAFCGVLVLTGCFELGRPNPAQRRLLREAMGTMRSTGGKPPGQLTNRTLTPRDVLYSLVRRNTRLRVARLDQRLRNGQAQALVRLENPELRVMNLTGGLADEGHGGLALRLRWSPPIPGAHRARQALIRERARASAHSIRTVLYELVGRARLLLAEIRAVDSTIRIYRGLAAIQKQRLRRGQRGVSLGTRSHLDAALLRLTQLDLQQKHAALQTRREVLSSQVLALVGAGPGCRIAVTAGPSRLPPLPSLAGLKRDALARHPALLAEHHRARAQKAALWLARAQQWPWLSFVQLSYDVGESRMVNRFAVGFGVRLPLLSWNLSGVRLERQRLLATSLRSKLLKLRIAREITASHRRLAATRWAVLRYEQQLRPQLRKLLAQARRAAKQESADLDKVDAVRVRVQQLELIAQHRRLLHDRARIELERLSYQPVWRRHGVRLFNK